MDTISKKRSQIHKKALTYIGGDAFFDKLNKDQLHYIFDLYDKLFFNNEIKHKIKEEGSTLTIIPASDSMTKTGGLCTKIGCEHSIKIAFGVLSQTFVKNKNKLSTNGLECEDRLNCLQLVLEHEMIHLIVNLWSGQFTNKDNIKLFDSHGHVFRCLAKSFFGHTDVTHGLLSVTKDEEDTKPKAKISDFKIGDYVKTTYKGKELIGIVKKVNVKTIGVEIPIKGKPGQNLVPLILTGSYQFYTKIPPIKDYLNEFSPPKTNPKVKKEIAKSSLKNNFDVGERVSYIDNGKKIFGIIQRRGPQRATVKLDTGGGMYVPYMNLTSEEKVERDFGGVKVFMGKEFGSMGRDYEF
jgi:hypothetical protein